jgi:hypothetical protein
MSRLFPKSILVLLLAGILLLSLTTTAGATAAQLWYLDGRPHNPIGANNVMQKTMGIQSGWAVVGSGGSMYWLAENAAKTDVAFPGGSWVVELSLDDQGNNALAAVANCVDSGYLWEATIGGWNTSTGWYEIPTITTATISWDSSNVLIIELQTDPATIFEDDYLALKVTNKDNVSHTINTDGRSSLRSPDTDPGYPLPELPTAILLGIGFVGLLGFARMKRTKAPVSA